MEKGVKTKGVKRKAFEITSEKDRDEEKQSYTNRKRDEKRQRTI